MSDEKHGAAADEGYEPDLLTLEDENGQEHTFEVVDAADVNGQRYMAMVPYHADAAQRLAEDAEMLIMRLGVDEEGLEYLDLVEEEDELRTAGEAFLQRLSEVYDIDLDELERSH